MPPEQHSTSLVVIGASAGGIEALSTLVSTLPAAFPAPVVVAQHLDPRRPSHLAEILGRRSAVPVRTVSDHTRLGPGVIFVAPSNRHVVISDQQARLHAEGPGRSKPSVNLLFESAAQAFGERHIAVVLTGTDSDGAAGALHVKEAGGTVLIQDPQSAAFPSMPASVAPAAVDIVAPLERIGPLLHALMTGAYLPHLGTADGTLPTLLAQVRERSGIDFTRYKMPTIQRRLQRRMAAVGTEHLSDYLQYVQDHPEEYQRLVTSLLIKVTEFFRDPELFSYLRVIGLLRLQMR